MKLPEVINTSGRILKVNILDIFAFVSTEAILAIKIVCRCHFDSNPMSDQKGGHRRWFQVFVSFLPLRNKSFGQDYLEITMSQVECRAPTVMVIYIYLEWILDPRNSDATYC